MSLKEYFSPIENLIYSIDCHTLNDCENCNYASRNNGGCMTFLLSDISDALREVHKHIDEIEQLRAEVHNLRLYLSEIYIDHTDLMHEAEIRHPGLPGFVWEEQV